MQIMFIEAEAQWAKENLAECIYKACKQAITMEVIQTHVKHFLSEHWRSNSISRTRDIAKYIENKNFNHGDPSKMLQIAWNCTRKAWVR